jgi:hypothetical protein
VAKPGDQWRPAGQRSKRKRGTGSVGPADGRRPGPGDNFSLAREERSWFWFSSGRSGDWLERRLRQGASVVTSSDSWSAENADASFAWDNWASFGRPEAAKVAAAGRCGVNRVVTQGRRCRQRLFGVVVEGSVSKFTFARGRRRGTDRDGRNDASRKLESWGPCGFS